MTTYFLATHSTHVRSDGVAASCDFFPGSIPVSRSIGTGVYTLQYCNVLLSGLGGVGVMQRSPKTFVSGKQGKKYQRVGTPFPGHANRIYDLASGICLCLLIVCMTFVARFPSFCGRTHGVIYMQHPSRMQRPYPSPPGDAGDSGPRSFFPSPVDNRLRDADMRHPCII
jgi:hypothetical protein